MFALTHWWSLVPGGMALMWAVGRLVKRYSYARFTVLTDLPILGHPRVGGKVGQTAVVCGGSIAGLLSARVLSDHFEEVVIIDPDADVLLQRALAVDALRFPDGKDVDEPARPRVMQWTAYHLAQTMFFTTLDKLFPSLRAELAAGDVPSGPGDYNLHLGGVHLPLNVGATPAGMRTTFGLTRAANETLVRRLVAQTCPNVRFLAGTVLGVVPTAGGKSLEAVQYRPTADSRQVKIVKAAIVADCSGSTNAGLGWLQRAGYPLAKEDLDENYHPHMRYSTCVFQVDPDVIAKIKPPHICADSVSLGFFFPVQWLDSRHFAIEHVEGGKLVIAGGGAGFEGKITNVDELRAHIESINQLEPTAPWVLELLDYVAGTPAQTATYSDNRVSALRRIKYAQHAHNLPRNFVAVGDALMRLNPVNGQGLSKAAVEAIALDACLRRVHTDSTHPDLPADFAAKYFARVAGIADGVWTGTKLNDYGEETCTPSKGESLELGSFNRRINRVVVRRIIRGDADLWLRVMSVRGWLMPSNGLLAPSIVLKVIWELFWDVLEGGKTGDLP